MTELEKQIIDCVKNAQEKLDNMALGYRYGVDIDELSGEDKEYIALCHRIKELFSSFIEKG